MAKIQASPEQLKPQKQPKPGVVTLTLDKFDPKPSKDKGSTNLNPILLVAEGESKGARVWENLNTKATWVWKDFVHAFGLKMADGDDGTPEVAIPGEFVPGDSPKFYDGPLVPKNGNKLTCKAELIEVPSVDKQGKQGTKVAIKRYFCAVPGCLEEHNESLV